MALSRLVQVRNEPTSLARIAALSTLYGEEHPYGRLSFGTPTLLKAITRDDLKRCYREHVRPDLAALVAVGDVTSTELIPELEDAFAEWKPAAASAVEQSLPALPAAKPTSVVLVDKPGAAQSVISVSLIGADRKSPDYYSLVVMNSVFGGQFSSRLNLNLREKKGYTYGRAHVIGLAGPAEWPLYGFVERPNGGNGSGPGRIPQRVRGHGRRSAGYGRGGRVLEDLPDPRISRRFRDSGPGCRGLETLVEYHLPDDYFNTYIPRISAVTAADVLAVAKKYLHLENLSIVVVGDCSQIESSLRALPVGKSLTVYHFDQDFHLTPAK